MTGLNLLSSIPAMEKHPHECISGVESALLLELLDAEYGLIRSISNGTRTSILSSWRRRVSCLSLLQQTLQCPYCGKSPAYASGLRLLLGKLLSQDLLKLLKRLQLETSSTSKAQ